MKKLLLTLMLLLSLGFAASAQVQEELLNTKFSGMSYTKAVEYTGSNGAVYSAQANNNSGFQLRTSKKNTGITVKSAPVGFIVSTIEVTMSKEGGGVNVYAADETISLSSPGSAIGATGSLTTKTFEINKPYFAITATNDAYCVVSKIVVNWVPEGGDDRSEVTLAWSETELSLNLGDTFIAPTLSATIEGVESEEAKAAVVLTSSNEELLSIVDGQMVMNEGIKGVATVTASIPATNDTFKAQSAEFTLTVVDPNASETIFDFSTFGWSNQKEISTVDKDIVTLAFDKGSNNNPPKYFTNGNDVRLYGGGSLTISVPEGYVITKIESVYNNKNNTLAANSGEFNSDYTLWTATEDVNSVVFTESGTSGNRSWKKLTVYYAKADGKAAAGLEFAETSVTTYTGDEFTAPVLSNPNNLTVAWTSSNVEVATVDAEGKVTVKGIGTTTIAAASEETEEFRAGSASYTLTVVAAAHSIAEMKTLAPEKDNQVLVKFPLTVVYVNGANTYVVDEAGDATLIYGYNLGYNKGDEIPADWTATYSPFNGLPEWKMNESPAAVATGKEITYADVESISMDDINRVVVLKNVTFEAATPAGKIAFTGKYADGTVVNFYNQFATASAEAGIYDVTVAVSYNQKEGEEGVLQAYPISYENLPLTVSATSGDSEYAENDDHNVAYGTKVVFTVGNNLGEITGEVEINGSTEALTFENGKCEYTVTSDVIITISVDGKEFMYGFTIPATIIKGLTYEVDRVFKNTAYFKYMLHVDNHYGDESGSEYKVVLTVNEKPFQGEHSLMSAASAPRRELSADDVPSTHTFAGNVGVDGLEGQTPYTATLHVEHNGKIVEEHTINDIKFETTNTTGIEDVTVDGNEAAEYFNLQGVRVAQPEAGRIYIVRRGANVAKELVK